MHEVGFEDVVPGEGQRLVEGAGVIARGEEEAVVLEEEGSAGGFGAAAEIAARASRSSVKKAELKKPRSRKSSAVAVFFSGDGEHRRGLP
jgi:hypothetical protein